MNEQAIARKDGRLAQATRHLKAEALDGLIAASNGLNSFLDSNAVYVLCGVRPIGDWSISITLSICSMRTRALRASSR